MKKIFAVAALLSSSPLLAQDTTGTLGEVIVSANKYSNKTALTGKVVTVISRQDIERAGGRDLAQLITEQGGVYLNGAASNPGKDKSIYLRGARVEHTLVTIDGVPVYDATGIGGNFDIRSIPIDNVERIEVLKGSQSTLYGSDAIAGVINIITRKGGTKPVGGYYVVNYGSFNTLRANAGINGKNGKVDYNLGYSYFDTEGISEAEQPAGATEEFDKDPYTQYGVNYSFGYQPTKSWRLQPYLRYAQNKGGLDIQGFMDSKDYTTKGENLQAGLRNELAFGAAKLNVLYNYTNTSRKYYQSFGDEQYKSGEHFGEAYLVYPFGGFTLTGGADYRTAHTDITTSYMAMGKDSAHHSQLGVYTALNYNNGAGFTIEGGGRLNLHSEYGGHVAYNLNPSYLVSQQWKVFANLSSGYKTPSLYQLFSNIGNPELKPEQSINLEGGMQFFTKNGKASVRGTYFRRRIQDIITYSFNATLGRPQYVNQNKQSDHGLELDAKWSPSAKLQLKAFYSYIDGELTTSVNGKDSSYYNLHRRPKSALALTAGSQLTPAFYISAQANVVGRNKDLTFEPPTYDQKEITLGGYTLLSLYAECALFQNRIKLFADLRNVLDQHYNEIYGYAAPGFNGYGGVRFTF